MGSVLFFNKDFVQNLQIFVLCVLVYYCLVLELCSSIEWLWYNTLIGKVMRQKAVGLLDTARKYY